MAKILKDFSISFTDFPFSDSDWATMIYFIGCSHGCEGCHNPELQNKKGFGLIFDEYEEENIDLLVNKINNFCMRNYTKKVVLSGGDPLFYIDFTKKLLAELKKLKLSVCVYTGYGEEFCKQENIIDFEYLKTGKYERRLSQKGKLASSNQKIFNKNYEDVTDLWK